LPDSGRQTVELLSHLVLATSSNGSYTPPISVVSSATFSPSFADILVNTLWFLSLFVSIFCALAATLIQQWIRTYLRGIDRRAPPRKRGPVHIYLLVGLDKFKFDEAVTLIVGLLHLSVLLFIIGLAANLLFLNTVVAWFTIFGMASGALLYSTLSVLPLKYPDCPYHTPLTSFLAVTVTAFEHGYIRAKDAARVLYGYTNRRVRLYVPFHPSVRQMTDVSISSARISSLQLSLETSRLFYLGKALHRTLPNLDEAHEIETFLYGLPAIYESFPNPYEKSQILCELLVNGNLFDHLANLAHFYSSSKIIHIHRVENTFRISRLLISELFKYASLDTRIAISLNEGGPLRNIMLNWKTLLGTNAKVSMMTRIFVSYLRADILDLLAERVNNKGFPADVSSDTCNRLLRLLDNVRPMLSACRMPWPYFAITKEKRMSANDIKAAMLDNFYTLLDDLLTPGPDNLVDIPDPQSFLTLGWRVGNLYFMGNFSPPSPRLLDLLRKVGLEQWLVPGSDFSHGPSNKQYETYMERFPRVLEGLRVVAWASEPLVIQDELM
jgi:hypothetical protein